MEVATSYGFTNVVTVEQLHAQTPILYNDMKAVPLDPDCNAHAPIAAILVMIDPLHWGRELQLCCDVLQSDGVPGQLVPHVFLLTPKYSRMVFYHQATRDTHAGRIFFTARGWLGGGEGLDLDA